MRARAGRSRFSPTGAEPVPARGRDPRSYRNGFAWPRQKRNIGPPRVRHAPGRRGGCQGGLAGSLVRLSALMGNTGDTRHQPPESGISSDGTADVTNLSGGWILGDDYGVFAEGLLMVDNVGTITGTREPSVYLRQSRRGTQLRRRRPGLGTGGRQTRLLRSAGRRPRPSRSWPGTSTFLSSSVARSRRRYRGRHMCAGDENS
jgi:hypothetical protein